jgi:hypothetical protein
VELCLCSSSLSVAKLIHGVFAVVCELLQGVSGIALESSDKKTREFMV